MSFDDKNYPNRKDHRKCYYKSGKHDRTCRPHGSCSYCERNRSHSTQVRILKSQEDKEEEKE